MTVKLPCQHCSARLDPRAHARHEESCAKYPGEAKLRKLIEVEGLTIARIVKRYKTSHNIVKGWLKRAGVAYKKSSYVLKPRPKALWELSVLEPCQGQCHKCGWLFICRERVAADRPILSEAPLESEVELWVHNGWVLQDWRGEGLRDSNSLTNF